MIISNIKDRIANCFKGIKKEYKSDYRAYEHSVRRLMDKMIIDGFVINYNLDWPKLEVTKSNHQSIEIIFNITPTKELE